MRVHSWIVGLLLAAGLTAVPGAYARSQSSKDSAGSAVQIYIQRARTQDAEGRHDLAVANWRQVLLLSPGQPEALAALARYYQQQGDNASARVYLRRLHDVAPHYSEAGPERSQVSDQQTLDEAASLTARHQYAQALALYRKVLGDNPTSGDWAVDYYQTEAAIPADLPDAIQHLRKIVAGYPANPGYQLTLARVLTYGPSTRAEGLSLLENFQGPSPLMQQARTAWRQALFWNPASPAAQQSGEIYLQRYPDSELAARLRDAREQLAHAPEQGSPEEAKGYRELQQGNLSAAAKDFSTMLADHDLSARAHVGLGYVYMKQQDFNDAVLSFEQARTEGLRSPSVEDAYRQARYWDLMQQGTTALNSGDSSSASQFFEQASQADSGRPEADLALAGLWVKEQQPEKALPILQNLIQRHPENEQTWLALVDAELQAGQFAQLLAEQKNIPSATLSTLNQDPEYLSNVATADLSLGNDAAAQQILAQLNALPYADAASHAKIQLKLANLMLSEDRAEEAVSLSRDAVRLDRANPAAWSTLIRAEDQAGRDGSALELIDYLPAHVKDQLMLDPAFLIQAASIYQKGREFDGAALMLAQARKVGGRQLQTSVPLELQSASLDQQMGRIQAAYDIYKQLLSQQPDRAEAPAGDVWAGEAWTGLLSTLHASHHDQDALNALGQIPLGLRFHLRYNTNFLQTVASIYAATGNNPQALASLSQAAQHYREQGIAVPFGVGIQLAWLQLNTGDQAGLAASMRVLSAAPSLSLAQKKQEQDIWVAWTVRRAEASFKQGDAAGAFQLVTAAQQVYPFDANLRREIGSLYIRANQPDKAFQIYQHFDWDGASEADFSGGIAAAAASGHWKEAEIWLGVALRDYPRNTDLLTQAAQMEQSRGNIKQAEAYWEALRSIDNLNTPAALAEAGTPGANPTARLAALLTPPSDPSPAQTGASADQLDNQSNQQLLFGDPGQSNSGQSPSQPSSESSVPAASIPSPAASPIVNSLPASSQLVLSPVSMNQQPPAPTTNQMAEQLASAAQSAPAASQNWSSSQQAAASGYNAAPAATPHLSVLPVSLNTSTADAGMVAPAAFTLAANGLMDSPAELGVAPVAAGLQPAFQPGVNALQQKPDGLSTLQAELSPWVGGGFSVASRSGEAGFDQLTRVESTMEGSTVLGQTARITVMAHPVLLQSGQAASSPIYAYGASGTAPATSQYASGVGGEVQLATSHVQASLGYSPASFAVHNTLGSFQVEPSPYFSLHFVRTPVTETMLSYAGLKDPATGQVWGGVVATGGGFHIGKGTAQSGFYADMDYRNLTGRNVTANTSYSGSLGGYWLGYTNEYGNLTFGANMTGEHYDKNLQYFTFGQGGYFSPDVYMLVNAPITWHGTSAGPFAYTVNASIGMQSYQPGTIVAGSFLTSAPNNPGASANYALNASGSYRITPNWSLEGFLSANNTYDYQQRMAGLSFKYMERPHPTNELSPTGLFDPQAIRPLVIP